MSYKVIRNSLGDLVAFGPNDDHYEPVVKAGESLTIEAAIPAPSASQVSEAEKEASKLAGVSILGVMCSATKDDQSGLSAVALGVTLARMAAQTFPDTKFEFSNGNSLVITNANFDSVYAAWTPFRQLFFAP